MHDAPEAIAVSCSVCSWALSRDQAKAKVLLPDSAMAKEVSSRLRTIFPAPRLSAKAVMHVLIYCIVINDIHAIFECIMYTSTRLLILSLDLRRVSRLF